MGDVIMSDGSVIGGHVATARAVVTPVTVAAGSAWFRGRVDDAGLLVSALPMPGQPFFVFWQEIGGDLAGFTLAFRRWGRLAGEAGFAGNLARAVHPHVLTMLRGPLAGSTAFADSLGPRYFFPGRGPLMKKLLARYAGQP